MTQFLVWSVCIYVAVFFESHRWSKKKEACTESLRNSQKKNNLTHRSRISFTKITDLLLLCAENITNYITHCIYTLTLLRQSAAIEFFSVFTATFNLFPGKFTKYHIFKVVLLVNSLLVFYLSFFCGSSSFSLFFYLLFFVVFCTLFLATKITAPHWWVFFLIHTMMSKANISLFTFGACAMCFWRASDSYWILFLLNELLLYFSEV